MARIKLFGNTRPRRASRRREAGARRSPLKIITIILLIFAVLEAIYFICVYSNIPFIAKYRKIYIQTAMSTMRHQWLATAFIPSGVINEVMDGVAKSREDQVGHESTWQLDLGSLTKPFPIQTPDGEDAPEPDTTRPTEPVYTEEDLFYQLFWELDAASVDAYLDEHPEALDGGWENLCINEAGLNDSGTSIRTTMGEQVLAIDVPNQILLIRVEGGGALDQYQGVLAVAKDPSRLSIKNSAYLGSAGQYAGTIAANNNGVLAMTGSAFIDNGGVGNGGTLAGYMMSDGQDKGYHMGYGNKRIELRENNFFYITDVTSPVHEDTTDAVEFAPALIVDGETLVDENCGWMGVHPRTVIGQSDLGEILMLAIEGRMPGRSLGTDVVECAKILERHNCMQALNLDGGTSTILWYDGEYVIRCSNQACPEGRLLPNAFVYARG